MIVLQPKQFNKNNLVVPDAYRSYFDLQSVKNEFGRFTSEDQLEYEFLMIFGNQLKKERLSERHIIGNYDTEFEKAKVMLAEIINIPGEKLHHVAQMQIHEFTEHGQKGSDLSINLTVADHALGYPTDIKIIDVSGGDSNNRRIIQQGFVTNRPNQLPQHLLRETALVNKIGLGGWRDVVFNEDDDFFCGNILGYVPLNNKQSLIPTESLGMENDLEI